MTDPTADGAIQNPAHDASAQQDSVTHDAAPLVPESSIPHDAAADAPKESIHAAGKQPSKEITLQRLTPHNSWEDYAFRDEATIDQAANAVPPHAAQRRLSIAAIVTIAAAVGAIGGAFATAGVGHYLKSDQAAAAASASAVAAEQARAADSAIAKVNAEIAALKSNSAAQSAKIAERIDRIEKAQAEPAAKLAKLSETVDKLRAPATTTAAAASPETTGSIKPQAAQPNRLPLVDGWTLREVYDGIATVVGRSGIYDVIPGDPLPGVGRVDAIRKQDGRWVVVTSRGLIVAR